MHNLILEEFKTTLLEQSNLQRHNICASVTYWNSINKSYTKYIHLFDDVRANVLGLIKFTKNITSKHI
jgi:hypothetical protein